MCTCNQLSKRAITHRKNPASIRSAYLIISTTHMHMALCMYTCSCMRGCMPTQLCLPSLSPLAHSNRVYASVPRCMPIARLGLIHNTMPSHIRTPFSKSQVNVWVRLCMFCACACKFMRAYVRVTKGGLKACVCLHVSVCIYACVSVFVCFVCHTHAHTIGRIENRVVC